jgi:hypothetical protein
MHLPTAGVTDMVEWRLPLIARHCQLNFKPDANGDLVGSRTQIIHLCPSYKFNVLQSSQAEPDVPALEAKSHIPHN